MDMLRFFSFMFYSSSRNFSISESTSTFVDFKIFFFIIPTIIYLYGWSNNKYAELIWAIGV